MLFDLDADKVTLSLNGKGLFQWDVSWTIWEYGKTTQLGAVNFFAIENAEFYIDGICLTAVPENSIQKAEGRSRIQTLTRPNLPSTVKQVKSSGMTSVEAQLLQNYPNPAPVQTTIPYYIPMEVNNASLQITGLDGRTIHSLPIYEKGSSRLVLPTHDLAEGIWYYTLILDDTIIDTKKNGNSSEVIKLF